MTIGVLEVSPQVLLVRIQQFAVYFGLEPQDLVVVLDQPRQHLYVLVESVFPQAFSQLEVRVEL